MSLIKTAEEIEKLREGGALLSQALQSVVNAVEPGISMRELDAIAERQILSGGGKPSFKGFKGGGTKPFPSTLCISRNQEVVHGLGGREVLLQSGDIVGLDIGLWLYGLSGCSGFSIACFV